MEKKYECCECGWVGLHEEKDKKTSSFNSCMTSDICPNCEEESFYEINNKENNIGEQNSLSDAIQFGNWINRNAEKWGDEWAMEDGKNYTTSELYKKFKNLI